MSSLLSHHNHWHRLRWQIFWGGVAGTIPLAFRIMFFGAGDLGRGLTATFNAFSIGLAAIFLGILLIRSVGRYPGVEKASAIIPSFSVSFGGLILMLLMLRFDYSRWGLAGSYLSAITIFYFGYAQIFGRKRLTIGAILTRGDRELEEIFRITDVDWIKLHDPTQHVSSIEAVTVDLRANLSVEWEQRIADFALSGIPVYHSKHLAESLTGRVELKHLSETSFGTLSPASAYMVPKHIGDRMVAALALIVLAPFLLIVGLLIRLDTPGPAIFRQTRIGFRGKPFTVYKFRTMRTAPVGSQDTRDAAITQTDDHRITRLGAFLRKSRIDELPQIANVLAGEMSWIGPRPEAAVLSSWYENEIPFYRYRHIVRPGITGWAQVMQGHVADVAEVRSKLYYDFYYIKNFSLWIDSLIVVKTIVTMLTGFGAK